MKFFVIEGVDGAGKSTQINMLKEYFTGKGFSCEYLHFPRTDQPYFGELIAKFLRGEFGSLENVNPYLVAMIYAGDRKDSASLLKGWLKEDKIVLLDRYTYSNVAYQCAKLHSEDEQEKLLKWILSLEFIHFAIPRPDLNIFLDVPQKFTEKKLKDSRSGDDRKYLNGTIDIHEQSIDFQKRVRDMYLKVAASDDRLAVINCSNNNGDMLSPDEIFKKIIGLLKINNFLN